MTLQDPADRVQVVLLKVPVELLENVTIPVGVTAPVPEESVTVAVHVVGLPVVTEAGEQVIEVDDDLIVDVTLKVPLLPVCRLSPL